MLVEPAPALELIGQELALVGQEAALGSGRVALGVGQGRLGERLLEEKELRWCQGGFGLRRRRTRGHHRWWLKKSVNMGKIREALKEKVGNGEAAREGHHKPMARSSRRSSWLPVAVGQDRRPGESGEGKGGAGTPAGASSSTR